MEKELSITSVVSHSDFMTKKINEIMESVSLTPGMTINDYHRERIRNDVKKALSQMYRIGVSDGFF